MKKLWRAASGVVLLASVTAISAQAPTAPAPLLPAPSPQVPPSFPSATPQVIGPKSPVAAPVTAHPLEGPDLEAFFDGIFPLQLERSDVAGATVLVMKDGNVLLSRGYGYANVKTKKAVDPNATIFRLASIS